MTGLDNTKKCTWLVKVFRNAPGFKVLSNTNLVSKDDVYINYIEYDHTVPMLTNDLQDFIDGRNNNSIPDAILRDQSMYVGGELPMFE